MTTHVCKVVGSNPGAVYWMDIFTLICCHNCNVCLERPKINKKRPGMAHLKKTFSFLWHTFHSRRCQNILPNVLSKFEKVFFPILLRAVQVKHIITCHTSFNWDEEAKIDAGQLAKNDSELLHFYSRPRLMPRLLIYGLIISCSLSPN